MDSIKATKVLRPLRGESDQYRRRWSPEQTKAIRQLRRDGLTLKAIGELAGCSGETIRRRLAHHEHVLHRRATQRELVAQAKKVGRLGEINVSSVKLTVRLSNCLENAGITTFGQIVSVHPIDLLKLWNFGRKSLQEIRDALCEVGIDGHRWYKLAQAHTR